MAEQQQGVQFTEKAARRIAVVVREVEGEPVDLKGSPNRYRPDRQIWAKITDDDDDPDDPPSVVKHAWTEQRRTEDGFEDMPNGRSGTLTKDYAIATDGKAVKGDEVVRLVLNIAEDGSSYWTVLNTDAKGTLKYQVYQMVTDNKSGWDWVRFH